MVPSFVRDWVTGLRRFKDANPHYDEFDRLGRPRFAGWIFNGFDTARQRRSQAEIQDRVAPKARQMVQADRTFHDRLNGAIAEDLVSPLRPARLGYDGVAGSLTPPYRIGDIEDANVLIQNSLWQNVPLGQLHTVQQLTSLQDRSAWAWNQLEQIDLLRSKLGELSERVEAICT